MTPGEKFKKPTHNGATHTCIGKKGCHCNEKHSEHFVCTIETQMMWRYNSKQYVTNTKQ